MMGDGYIVDMGYTIDELFTQMKERPDLLTSNERLNLGFYREVREHAQTTLTSSLEQIYTILPKSLRIGTASFADVQPITMHQWRVRFKEAIALDVETATLQEDWNVPDQCFFAINDELQLIYIDFPNPIGGKTMIWFCKEQWQTLVHAALRARIVK